MKKYVIIETTPLGNEFRFSDLNAEELAEMLVAFATRWPDAKIRVEEEKK